MDFENFKIADEAGNGFENKISALIEKEADLQEYIDSVKVFLSENKRRDNGKNIFFSILLMIKNGISPDELKENTGLLNIEELENAPAAINIKNKLSIKLKGKIGELDFSTPPEETNHKQKERIMSTDYIGPDDSDKLASLMQKLKAADYDGMEEKEEIEKEINEIRLRLKTNKKED